MSPTDPLSVGYLLVHETERVGAEEDGRDGKLADVPHPQLLCVIHQLAAWGLVDGEFHLLGGEVEQGADKRGLHVHRHDALLERVLANDPVANHALVNRLRPEQGRDMVSSDP